MLKGFSILQKKRFINTNTIIEIQKTLEHNNAGIRKLPGTALKNASTGKVIYTPPDNHSTILQLLKNFEEYLNEHGEIPPLITLAVQHYQFESIHPFYDGNGRTGRIINILHLVLHGLLENPLLYLSAYIIENKRDYYRLLQEVRTKNNWEGWILYMLNGIEQSATKTIGQIKDINQLFEKTQEKIKKGLQKTYTKELLEVLFEHPYCKIENITQRLGISRITATKYLKELELLGVLQSKKIWKETIYINTGLYNLLKK
jgi:Fic family protein